MLTGLLETRFALSTQLVRRQLLPKPGEVLVRVGDRVQVNDLLAEAPREGQLHIIDLAQPLGVSVRALARYTRVTEGQQVAQGTPLASIHWPRLTKRAVLAPCAGTVQAIVDGRLFLRQSPEPYRLRAYLPGQVIETYPHRGVAIGAVGALVRGIWGSGGRRQGALVVMVSAPGDVLTWEMVSLRYRGTILVGGILDDARVLYRASRFRLNGLIVGSITAGLRTLCERLSLPVVVTEGMGRVPLARPVYELLLAHHSHAAVISGASEDGQSGPEVIIPLSGSAASGSETVPAARALVVAHPLEVGALVRLTRPPYLGLIGRVILLPTTPQETAIGTRALGAQVRLADGRQVFAPYVNLELLG
jgi:hypothetical protein